MLATEHAQDSVPVKAQVTDSTRARALVLVLVRARVPEQVQDSVPVPVLAQAPG